MNTRDINELHTKTEEELQKMLTEARAAKQDAAMLLAQLKARNTREMYNKRKEIARILTVLNLKRKDKSYGKNA